jgi:hypothetical protein
MPRDGRTVSVRDGVAEFSLLTGTLPRVMVEGLTRAS